MVTPLVKPVFVLGAFCMFCSYSVEDASAQNAPLEVIPPVKEFIPDELSFAVTDEVKLLLGEGCTEEDLFAAGEFNNWLAELGYRALEVQDVKKGEAPSTGAILVGPPLPGSAVAKFLEKTGVRFDEPAQEGYLIAVAPTGAVVTAETATGRFYGLMTLAQMFYRSGILCLLPGGVVRDRPALSLRGISDDISRGQVSTLEDMKTLVRFLARYKMNLYMPYLEDMFRFRLHPEIGAGRGALNAEEVKELVEFARRFHVRIVPIFQTLGHYDNLLLKENYRHLAEFPGAHCLSPALEETYGFLREVLGEIIPAFQDEYFHIACDESWDVGKGKSRALVREHGIDGVHAMHYRKVYDMVTGLGRKVMMYGDIILSHPSIMDQIPKDIVIVDWHYNAAADYPSVARFTEAGFKVVVSPGLSNWDRLYPDYSNSLTNIENLIRAGFEKGALGAVTSSWCDFGAANLRQHNLWGYAFAAACAWNPGKLDRERLERTFWKKFLALENAEAMLELNRLLATLGQGHPLYDWWRHPLLGPSPRGPAGKKNDPEKVGRRMTRDMEQAAELLSELQSKAGANHWFLDLLAYDIEAGACLGRKYLWQADYAAGTSGDLGRKDASSLADGAEYLGRRYAELKKRYAETWLKYNRPEGLENILRLFQRQIMLWNSIAEKLHKGEKPAPGEIASTWITPAGSGDSVNLKKSRQAFFRKKITINSAEPPIQAKLQLMGKTHVLAYLNGEFLGEVIARRSLSVIVENEMAKIVDLTGRLKQGENVLAVKVTNYEGKVPLLNLYGEIYSGGGELTRRILTAEDWLGLETDDEPPGWMNADFEPSGWKPCEKFPYPLTISAPDFAAGFNSRIER